MTDCVCCEREIPELGWYLCNVGDTTDYLCKTCYHIKEAGTSSELLKVAIFLKEREYANKVKVP